MTDLSLSLTVIQAIHLHGDITERIARDKHKLDALVSMRAAITSVPDMSEGLLIERIRDNEAVLANLTTLLYGGVVSDEYRSPYAPEQCLIEGHIPGCPGAAGGDHEWEDHQESHPETVEGCSECERRAERSAEMWQRAMSPY